MAKSELEIIVNGVDKFSNKIGKGADAIAKKMGAIGKSMTKMGGIMTASLTAPIVGGFSLAVKSASDLAESISAVEIVFGAAGDVIYEFGETSATAVGLSEEQFNSLAIVTGSFLQNLGYDAAGAAEETIKLTERASDMAAVFNTDVDQALMAIQSGLKGEFNPLEQFGVKMNAANIEAKALAMGLADAEGEIDDNAKAQAALAIVMEQTNRIQGTFAQEAESLGGSMRIVKAQLSDAAAALGLELLPYVTKAANWISELIGQFKELAPSTQKIIVIVGLIVAAIGPLLMIFGTLVTAIGSVVTFVSGTLIPALAPIIGPILAIIAVVALLALAWKTDFLGIKTALTDAWNNTILPALTQLWSWLKVNIPAAIKVLSTYWTTILLPAINAVWAFFQNNIIPIFNAVATVISAVLSVAIAAISSIWTNVLLPAITAIWSFVQTNLMPIFVALSDFFSVVFSLALTALAGLWENVLQPALETIWEWVSDKILPIFVALKDFWDTKFGPMIETIAEWLGEKLQPAFEGISTVVGTIVGWIETLTEKLKNIELPDWLTPGSPTPFETGLWGISKALKAVVKQGLPEFDDLLLNTKMTGMIGQETGNGGSTQSIVNHYNLTMPTSNRPEEIGMAFELLQAFGG